MNIDKLLTEYVDSLNSGKKISIEELLKQCPEKDRDELRDLCEMVKVFKKSIPQITVRQGKADQIFSHLEKMRQDRLGKNNKQILAANLNGKKLTDEEKEERKKISQMIAEKLKKG